MKTIVLATSLLAFAGCSDEADIGVDTAPVTCMTAAAGDMSGSAEYNGTDWNFVNGSPTLSRNTDGVISGVSIWSSENPDTQRGNYVRFYFGCGTPTKTTYGVASGGNDQLACPNEVSAAILGSIEILPAVNGTLIIDETEGCFAGRFSVDFENQLGSGEARGWFSIPLQ